MAKIILVDIDNVLADFDKAVLDVLKNEGIKKPDFKDFYIVNNFKEEYKEKIESIYLEPGFFANLKQIPNAIQGISRLEKEGFTVFLCSSLLYANPKALEDRR